MICTVAIIMRMHMQGFPIFRLLTMMAWFYADITIDSSISSPLGKMTRR